MTSHINMIRTSILLITTSCIVYTMENSIIFEKGISYNPEKKELFFRYQEYGTNDNVKSLISIDINAADIADPQSYIQTIKPVLEEAAIRVSICKHTFLLSAGISFSLFMLLGMKVISYFK